MRATTAVLILGCAAAGTACQPQYAGITGHVDLRVTGLGPDATDGGQVSVVVVGDPPLAPITVPVPPGEAGADVPPGTYHVTYTPPAGYRMTAGASQEADVTVVEGQSSLISFSVEPATGTLEVRVQGLGAGATSGGSAGVQRSDAPGVPSTVPIPASGAASSTVVPGSYSVTYTAPAGYVLGSGQIPTQVADVLDNATVTVTFAVEPAPPPPANYYPNEPAGFVLINERYFDATPQDAAGWTTPISAGFSFQSDGAALRSPPGVGQALIVAGQLGGVSPVDVRLDWSASPTRLYVAFWFKLSSGWLAPTSQQTRLLEIHVAPTSSNARIRLIAFGPDGGPYDARIHVLAPGVALPNNDRVLTPSLAVSQLWPGQWYAWELVLVMSAPGQNNGQARWWIGGVKVGEYTDVVNVPVSVAGPSWDLLTWHPFWEGRSPATTADQWQQIDHIRVSRN